MKTNEIRVKEIAEMHRRARESKKIADKSTFDRIFEAECRKLTDGRSFNIIHIKESGI